MKRIKAMLDKVGAIIKENERQEQMETIKYN